MADTLQIKAIPATGDATALQEQEPGDTQGVANGGIGLSTIAADQILYTSALDTLAPTPITAWGRARVADADVTANKAALAYGTAADATIGTSGDTVPKNNTANVFDQVQEVTAGIKIGGSAADNLLDSYDKNLNWTPVITCATPGDLAITYTAQVGRARVVGNRCDFNVAITTSSFTHTTASGGVTVSLPTTSEGTSGNRSACQAAIGGWVAPANYTALAALIVESSAVITLGRQPIAGGGLLSVNISELPTGSNIVINVAGSFEV